MCLFHSSVKLVNSSVGFLHTVLIMAFVIAGSKVVLCIKVDFSGIESLRTYS